MLYFSMLYYVVCTENYLLYDQIIQYNLFNVNKIYHLLTCINGFFIRFLHIFILQHLQLRQTVPGCAHYQIHIEFLRGYRPNTTSCGQSTTYTLLFV